MTRAALGLYLRRGLLMLLAIFALNLAFLGVDEALTSTAVSAAVLVPAAFWFGRSDLRKRGLETGSS
jgi:hypothetical protein